jgi:hypothetical protein
MPVGTGWYKQFLTVLNKTRTGVARGLQNIILTWVDSKVVVPQGLKGFRIPTAIRSGSDALLLVNRQYLKFVNLIVA